MAFRRNPGLLHSLPALIVGTALVVGGVVLFADQGLSNSLVTGTRFHAPAWLAEIVCVALGTAILLFGILSLRQTWREVRNRPTRDQWLGY